MATAVADLEKPLRSLSSLATVPAEDAKQLHRGSFFTALNSSPTDSRTSCEARPAPTSSAAARPALPLVTRSRWLGGDPSSRIRGALLTVLRKLYASVAGSSTDLPSRSGSRSACSCRTPHAASAAAPGLTPSVAGKPDVADSLSSRLRRESQPCSWPCCARRAADHAGSSRALTAAPSDDASTSSVLEATVAAPRP